jgi:imidazole glycerol-phosphate synthase subunit HisH
LADVVVIDSGGANLASLLFALERLGAEAEVSTDAGRIRSASHVLLPGVGAAHDAMRRLAAAGLTQVIPDLRQPVLGICLGMQLLYDESEEVRTGQTHTPCLGIVPGRVARLTAAYDQPVPHMGWNQLEPQRDDALLSGISPSDYVYFVHSYAAPVSDKTLAATDYGVRFTSVVRHRNFRGMQFHPERSARVGARLLGNFLSLQD